MNSEEGGSSSGSDEQSLGNVCYDVSSLFSNTVYWFQGVWSNNAAMAKDKYGAFSQQTF